MLIRVQSMIRSLRGGGLTKIKVCQDIRKIMNCKNELPGPSLRKIQRINHNHFQELQSHITRTFEIFILNTTFHTTVINKNK